MCYVIAPLGLELLGRARAPRMSSTSARSTRHEPPPPYPNPPPPRSPASAPSSLPVAGDRRLRQARHEVHVTGWALALERALGAGGAPRLRGPEESVLSPPLRSTPAGRAAIGPGELRLPGGRAPHDFLRTEPAGGRVEVERFETVRPDASVEVAGSALEHAGAGGVGTGRVHLLIERDDRLPAGSLRPSSSATTTCSPAGRSVSPASPAMAAGRAGSNTLVVFLCRDRPRARECARLADHLLCACRAYAGEHPHEWEYPGRAGIVFASERDAHEGLLLAYGVPPLPPAVRSAIGERRPPRARSDDRGAGASARGAPTVAGRWRGDAAIGGVSSFGCRERVLTLGHNQRWACGQLQMASTWREKTRAVARWDVRLPLANMRSPPPRVCFLLQSGHRAAGTRLHAVGARSCSVEPDCARAARATAPSAPLRARDVAAGSRRWIASRSFDSPFPQAAQHPSAAQPPLLADPHGARWTRSRQLRRRAAPIA